MCTSAGVRLLKLAPYSADMNPIEELFAEIKTFIKQQRHNHADLGWKQALETTLHVILRTNPAISASISIINDDEIFDHMIKWLACQPSLVNSLSLTVESSLGPCGRVRRRRRLRLNAEDGTAKFCEKRRDLLRRLRSEHQRAIQDPQEG